MRILFVHKARTSLGMGYSIRVEEMMHVLQRVGFDVYEACLPSATIDIKKRQFKKIVFNSLPIRKTGIESFSNGLLKSFANNLCYNYLNRICRRTKFDVIFAETSLLGWTAIAIGKKFSIPCITDVHGLAGAEAKGNHDKSWPVIERLESEVFKNSDHLLVVSNAMKQYMIHQFGISESKISVVPNGSRLYSAPAEFNAPLRIIYAGIFAYWEKINDYLDVAQKANVNNFNFFLAGTGPEKDSVLGRINGEKIQMQYVGYLPRAQSLKFMSQMQVGVAPSTWDLAREVAFPIKILDYMACGLPVVAPKVGDWGQIIEDEDCGIALKKDKLEDYLIALETLKEKKAWLTKSSNALKTIQTKYNWNTVLSPINSIIRDTAKK